MATGENQNLQIMLIVFAITTVVFLALTYVGFKQYTDQRKENEALNRNLQDAKNEYRQALAATTKYKKFMGFGPDDNELAVQDQFIKDMKPFVDNLPDNEQAYRFVLARYKSEQRDILQRETAAKEREQKLKDELAKVQSDAAKQITRFKNDLQTTTREKEAITTDFMNRRNALEQEQKQTAEMLESKRRDFDQLATAMEDAKRNLAREIKDIRQKNDKLVRKIREHESQSFEVADGTIVRVDPITKVVWINLGRADALRPQVNFSVYGFDEYNAAEADKKASIEVTRIFDRHLAEARILDDTPSNPILRGDQIYSPVWHQGHRQGIALAGLIDIDGDGNGDGELMTNLIKLNGGVIDAMIGNTGNIEGTMTSNTRYLVVGEQPQVTMEGTPFDAATVAKSVETYSKMVGDAENLGIEKISVRKFLDRLGWKPQDRTVRFNDKSAVRDFPAGRVPFPRGPASIARPKPGRLPFPASPIGIPKPKKHPGLRPPRDIDYAK